MFVQQRLALHHSISSMLHILTIPPDGVQEYEQARGKYIINKELMKSMQKQAVVLHPLPRVDEVGAPSMSFQNIAINQAPQPVPKMGDILPEPLNPFLSMRSCLFGAKVWFGMLGIPSCGSGLALCTRNLHFSYLDTATPAAMQHVHDACTSWSPLVDAIFEGDPAQSQTAAASVWEACC
eukprot:1158010-Pelagomonas_calceolata.AAC.8